MARRRRLVEQAKLGKKYAVRVKGMEEEKGMRKKKRKREGLMIGVPVGVKKEEKRRRKK
jgi:hypothetical protein